MQLVIFILLSHSALKSMEISLPYKDVISAQAESTAVPHEVHDEAFLTEYATVGTGKVVTENQFNKSSVLVSSLVPLIEAQIKPECSTFQDGIEQVLSSEHCNENWSFIEQVSNSYWKCA